VIHVLAPAHITCKDLEWHKVRVAATWKRGGILLMLASERRSTKRRAMPNPDRLYVTCCSTRARVWLTMVVVCWIVAFFSGLVWSAIHFLLLLRHPPWAYVLLASAPPALASAGVVWVLLAAWHAKHEAVEQRQVDLHEHLSTLIHLNDRVRNALQTIAYASYAPSEREAVQVVQESVACIERELRAAFTPEELRPPPDRLPPKGD
jgi:hypothetical protein